MSWYTLSIKIFNNTIIDITIFDVYYYSFIRQLRVLTVPLISVDAREIDPLVLYPESLGRAVAGLRERSASKVALDYQTYRICDSYSTRHLHLLYISCYTRDSIASVRTVIS